ncbi:hypothetical protein FB45DRAFT_1102670 [Roridomyces roridus]|uniref:BTB domain-containing protein n=1 Tax=Roridomyces roridus TaxID=1738132 RepID=A0AAD7CGR9_9AGAR|nr:hypothetical protein FB45DRAFT_1102670 [Roridomyces roridus]
MMSDLDTAATPPFVPTSPFDDPSADVILRSSDGVDFHVHRLILSTACPFFKQMFTLPQPASEPDIPAMPVSESAVLLNCGLRLWYPGADPAADEELELVCEALYIFIHKYDMPFLTSMAKIRLRPRIEEAPVTVYAIACRLRWIDVAVEAAQATLKLPIREFNSRHIDSQLSAINTDMYQALLHYHGQCGAIASAASSNLSWYTHSTGTPGAYCNASDSHCRDKGDKNYMCSNGDSPLRKWFVDHLVELTEHPAGSQICPHCGENGLARLRTFSALLEVYIRKELDSVRSSNCISTTGLLLEIPQIKLNLDF